MTKHSRRAKCFDTRAAILLLALVIVVSTPTIAAAVDGVPGPPAISARNAILVDRETGTILYAKEPFASVPIASLTKMMTAVVAMTSTDDAETTFVASEKACAVGESEMYLEPGEVARLDHLLYALLMKSANDAACTIAEGVAGSEPAFVERMNTMAAKLGLRASRFMNTHGLTADGHFSSAFDCAEVARVGLDLPLFKTIVATRQVTVPWPGKPHDRTFVNHNKLVLNTEFVKGIKTGYTLKAGHCLASYGVFENGEFIVVVLGAPSSPACYEESLALLAYGRDAFERRTVVRKGDELATTTITRYVWNRTVPVKAAADIEVLVRKDEPDPAVEVSIRRKPEAIREGDALGVATVLGRDGRIHGMTLVEAANDAIPPTVFSRLAAFFASLVP